MTKAKIHIMLMAILTDINKDANCGNSAGAGKVWIANGNNIESITVAAGSNEITAIAFTTESGKQVGWVKVQQDTDTLFGVETLAKPQKGVTVWTQQVGFEIGKLNPATSKSLMDLSDCALCEKFVFALKDNNAKYKLYGLVLDGGANAYTLRGLELGAGTTIQTGTDPTADKNGIIASWEGTASKEAPYLTGITDEATFFPALSVNA